MTTNGRGRRRPTAGRTATAASGRDGGLGARRSAEVARVIHELRWRDEHHRRRPGDHELGDRQLEGIEPSGDIGEFNSRKLTFGPDKAVIGPVATWQRNASG
jgi:hypothetical protein